MTVTEDLVLKLAATSSRGESLLGLSPIWIQCLPDLPPYVEVLEPQPQNYVFPSQEIFFDFKANDDYGIQDISLVIWQNGKESRFPCLPKAQRGQTVYEGKIIFPLENLNVKSHDILFAHLEVRDTYPGDPPHISLSPLFIFLIRDYWEGFRIQSPDFTGLNFRKIFDEVMIEQEKIVQTAWDYNSSRGMEEPKGWEEDEPLQEKK
jgi:hypothetical protein